MKKKTLTKKEIELLEVVKSEWIGKLNSLPKINKKQFEKYINWLYKLCDFDNPKIIYLDSPLACQYFFNILNNINNKVESQVMSQVGSQVRSQVWNQVGSQVRSQVRSQVGSQVKNQVENQVWNQVENQVRNQVENQVRNQVESQVRSQVGSQVRSQVENQVRSQVGSQVRSQVKNQVWNQVRSQNLKFFNFAYYGDLWDYGWVSFYNYMQRIGIKYNKKTLTNFNNFKKLLETGSYTMIQGLDFVTVSSMPIRLSRNPVDGRLHNLEDYAIEFKDGYKLAYLDGVNIDYELFEKFKNKELNYQEILKIENIEQRYVMLKYYGAEKLLIESNAKLICYNSKKGNKLYELNNIIPSKSLKLLNYKCPSTGREYVSFVPNDMVDSDEAMSWKFNISKNEYLRIKQES